MSIARKTFVVFAVFWGFLLIMSAAFFLINILGEEEPPPADPDRISWDSGIYVKFLRKEGEEFAGVVLPEKILVSSPPAPPGINHKRARMYLNQALRERGDIRPWGYVKVEEKRGYRVYMYRALTEEELKETERARKEMSRPLPSL